MLMMVALFRTASGFVGGGRDSDSTNNGLDSLGYQKAKAPLQRDEDGLSGLLRVFRGAITEDSAWMKPDRSQSHHNSSSKCSTSALTAG